MSRAPAYRSYTQDPPMPESIKALTRNRATFVSTQPRALIWPLRCADGRTWAQVKADRERGQ